MPRRKTRRRYSGKRLGHYLMQCDYSGQIGWDDEFKQTWDGHWVLERYWEERHPQDFVRSRPEETGVPVARPEGALVETCLGVYEEGVFDTNDQVFLYCVDSE